MGHLIAIFSRVHVSANSNPDWTRDSQSVADFENLFCVYLQVDGSHLPPCFGEKDVLTRLKIGISFRSCQVLFHGSLRDDTGIILCCNSISSSFLSLSIVCVVICSEQM